MWEGEWGRCGCTLTSLFHDLRHKLWERWAVLPAINSQGQTSTIDWNKWIGRYQSMNKLTLYSASLSADDFILQYSVPHGMFHLFSASLCCFNLWIRKLFIAWIDFIEVSSSTRDRDTYFDQLLIEFWGTLSYSMLFKIPLLCVHGCTW